MYLLSSFICYGCEASPLHFGCYNENTEREEGERKDVDLVLISLDNMALNDNFNMTISLLPGYSERGRSAVKSIEYILVS